jgi:hypothetical protein
MHKVDFLEPPIFGFSISKTGIFEVLMPRRDTLERDVKRRITKYLDSLSMCYYRMNVPFGFGKKSIDYEGCICGYFFGIEAKSPDDAADLTPLQRDCCLEILAGGGKVFVISCDDGLRSFKRWVDMCYKI